MIVEDTSLYLNALNGLPGPLIKWFLEKIGTVGIYNLVNKMKKYEAEAKCIIGYASNNRILFFEGSVKGKITKPKGKKGFGFDSIFIPIGYKKTFGEMKREEKNKISHRGIAFKKLKLYLKNKKTKK